MGNIAISTAAEDFRKILDAQLAMGLEPDEESLGQQFFDAVCHQPSETIDDNIYKLYMGGALPRPVNWTGQRQTQNATVKTLEVKMTKKHLAINVPVDVLESGNFKTFAESQIRQMATIMKNERIRHLMDVIADGNSSTNYPTATDEAMFANSHTWDGNMSIDNLGSITVSSNTNPTLSQVKAGIKTATSTMMTFKDNQGNLIHPNIDNRGVWILGDNYMHEIFREIADARNINATRGYGTYSDYNYYADNGVLESGNDVLYGFVTNKPVKPFVFVSKTGHPRTPQPVYDHDTDSFKYTIFDEFAIAPLAFWNMIKLA